MLFMKFEATSYVPFTAGTSTRWFGGAAAPHSQYFGQGAAPPGHQYVAVLYWAENTGIFVNELSNCSALRAGHHVGHIRGP
jgi:hypothetical protein